MNPKNNNNTNKYYLNTNKSLLIKYYIKNGTIDKGNTYEDVCEKLNIQIFKSNPQIIIPFIGIIFENDCESITVNYGLYTQCKNEKCINSKYCRKCNNQIIKHGALLHGDIFERFRSNNTKMYRNNRIKNYTDILIKQKYDIDNILCELENYNIEIPKKYMSTNKKSRAIVLHNVLVSDSEEENVVGRPKTIIKKVLFNENVCDEENLKKCLLNKEKYISEDEIEVKKISINGITKLTDGINVYELYNYKNIGKLKDFIIDPNSSDNNE